jgi:hypothetical protein
MSSLADLRSYLINNPYLGQIISIITYFFVFSVRNGDRTVWADVKSGGGGVGIARPDRSYRGLVG